MLLTTSNGGIFAIFDLNNRILHGIYTIRCKPNKPIEKRMKINMFIGAIEDMTQEEIDTTALGNHQIISRNFQTIIVDDFQPNHYFHL